MRQQRREYSMLFSAIRSLALAVALCVSWAPAARPQANIAPSTSSAAEKIHIRAVGPIAITVEDLDRSVDFYTRVLTFEKISDAEVAGDDVEHLFGVCRIRTRTRAASKLSTLKTPMSTPSRFSNSPRAKEIPSGSAPATGYSWELTTPPSWSPIPTPASGFIVTCSGCESRERAKTME